MHEAALSKAWHAQSLYVINLAFTSTNMVVNHDFTYALHLTQGRFACHLGVAEFQLTTSMECQDPLGLGRQSHLFA
jgi:hypothetical protein